MPSASPTASLPVPSRPLVPRPPPPGAVSEPAGEGADGRPAGPAHIVTGSRRAPIFTGALQRATKPSSRPSSPRGGSPSRLDGPAMCKLHGALREMGWDNGACSDGGGSQPAGQIIA
ncbi:hypothetical protein K456DRAFT_42576 [Colletotrichum gloeosporioides 23]|nr:hypothetical protein K456DRAFT_42576 [Colletotrichum gloeosporioides 23]